ncbi:MBL fold metallo-hydrolase [Thiohalomonas denitrificans]|uniref:Hydroxyacylglutathione hydrolase n=1 Tax=Thiohalomonas denitrificans TaxID=415747 RepID=A0A1G5QBX8_9GAMM|nr:rhodanese-like domain-containing protein [Thiohalomonas denitrificans]SCZ58990.1 hydroxyacylglutathione hydrolase [Thiohalomonas denitrificans]
MYFETIRSPGLAHLSYLIGDGGEAFVIDPRRDADVYLEQAGSEGMRITRIFETHRNEDYVIGSRELAERTGATIHHGAAAPFDYGESIREGNTFDAGKIRLRALETPGHTDESLSFALYDGSTGDDEAIGVFTGDALFVGGVGRTDFYPDRPEQVANLLYESLFDKILPLGDQTIVYPAHGAGSVCGAGLADRDFSTIGYERHHNPALQQGRDEFVRERLNEHHYQPPYFRQMETVNRQGPAVLGHLPTPRPLGVEAFVEAASAGMLTIDIREPEAISGALVPGSLAIPLGMLPSFAGWYLPYDRDIGLIVAHPGDIEPAVRSLVRLGYDRLVAWLNEGLHGWEMSGREYQTVPALYAGELKARMEGQVPFTLLDVRGRSEIEQAAMPGATEIYLGELPQRLNEIPPQRPITTFCGSGRRSIIASSILLQHGFAEVEVCLGSLAACKAVGCPIDYRD